MRYNSNKRERQCLSLLFGLRKKRTWTHLNATVRWTVAATSSRTGCYLNFCQGQKCISSPVARTMSSSHNGFGYDYSLFYPRKSCLAGLFLFMRGFWGYIPPQRLCGGRRCSWGWFYLRAIPGIQQSGSKLRSAGFYPCPCLGFRIPRCGQSVPAE